MAIAFWGRGVPRIESEARIELQRAARQGVRYSPRFEMRGSCRTSTVTMTLDAAQGQMILRQVDAAGNVVFERRAPPVPFFITGQRLGLPVGG